MDEQAARRWSCNLYLHHAWLLFSSLSPQTTHFLLTQWHPTAQWRLSPIQTGPVTDNKIDTCDTNWIQQTAWIITTGHGLPQHLSGGNNVVQARTFLLKYTRTLLTTSLFIYMANQRSAGVEEEGQLIVSPSCKDMSTFSHVHMGTCFHTFFLLLYAPPPLVRLTLI